MEIIIYTKNKKTDKDYMSAISEYAKRLSPFCSLRLVSCSPADKKRFSNGAHTKYYNITSGKNTISSEDFAELIKSLTLNGYSKVAFFINSDDAPDNIPLTSFSLDEGLTAAILAEQTYRAYTILNNITYHK